VDAYTSNVYGTASEDLENIYSDKHMKRVMEKIFEPTEIQEIKKNTFGVNLSKENGLAGLIRDLQENDLGLSLQTDND
jgi:hypothetical protein